MHKSMQLRDYKHFDLPISKNKFLPRKCMFEICMQVIIYSLNIVPSITLWWVKLCNKHI